MQNTLPFHRSIVSVIAKMTLGSIDDLAEIIKTTTIVGDWDLIANAWDARIAQLVPDAALSAFLESLGVRENLMVQKAEAQKESAVNLAKAAGSMF